MISPLDRSAASPDLSKFTGTFSSSGCMVKQDGVIVQFSYFTKSQADLLKTELGKHITETAITRQTEGRGFPMHAVVVDVSKLTYDQREKYHIILGPLGFAAGANASANLKDIINSIVQEIPPIEGENPKDTEIRGYLNSLVVQLSEANGCAEIHNAAITIPKGISLEDQKALFEIIKKLFNKEAPDARIEHEINDTGGYNQAGYKPDDYIRVSYRNPKCEENRQAAAEKACNDIVTNAKAQITQHRIKSPLNNPYEFPDLVKRVIKELKEKHGVEGKHVVIPEVIWDPGSGSSDIEFNNPFFINPKQKQTTPPSYPPSRF
ncbi:MAG: hypothetical protein WCF65_01665 [Parachlamydiaceae bacterium]